METSCPSSPLRGYVSLEEGDKQASSACIEVLVLEASEIADTKICLEAAVTAPHDTNMQTAHVPNGEVEASNDTRKYPTDHNHDSREAAHCATTAEQHTAKNEFMTNILLRVSRLEDLFTCNVKAVTDAMSAVADLRQSMLQRHDSFAKAVEVLRSLDLQARRDIADLQLRLEMLSREHVLERGQDVRSSCPSIDCSSMSDAATLAHDFLDRAKHNECVHHLGRSVKPTIVDAICSRGGHTHSSLSVTQACASSSVECRSLHKAAPTTCLKPGTINTVQRAVLDSLAQYEFQKRQRNYQHAAPGKAALYVQSQMEHLFASLRTSCSDQSQTLLIPQQPEQSRSQEFGQERQTWPEQLLEHNEQKELGQKQKPEQEQDEPAVPLPGFECPTILEESQSDIQEQLDT